MKEDEKKMKIYLFRHGETDWNKERRLQGQSDIPLNEFGRELAIRTAEALKEVPFDKAFSSPLGRAAETAKIILGERKVPLLLDDRLKEIHFGECEGQSFDTAKKDETHPLHFFFCRPERYVPPEGGESFEQAARRARMFLEERILPLEGECENVLIVAHGAFNRSLVNSIAGIPIEDFWHIGLGNCAASILSLKQGEFKVLEESRVYYGEPVNGRP